MGRSIGRVLPEDVRSPDQTFYHEPSDQHFRIYVRDGRLYQRRHQIDPAGGELNVVEMDANYVLGSGNHAKTYVHRNGRGDQIELPVAWYRENGGLWAMNPGYDLPDHMDFRRKLDAECFFCHTAYPSRAEANDPSSAFRQAAPEAIDCERCHGPGRTHMQRVAAGRPAAEIRAAIVNPARLSPDRQNEICFQCHLESTSKPLPYAVRRFGRGIFSYQPGEPLADYILHFDSATESPSSDRFEIDHAAYRMLQSACYRKSREGLRCAACHDPHYPADAAQAAERYRRVCLECHGDRPTSRPGKAGTPSFAARHPFASAESSCVTCHMPKRRAEDVVHVVMTDHLIQRVRPGREPVAQLREDHRYPGKKQPVTVALFYPDPAQLSPSDLELYKAVAQVADAANLDAGIDQLRKAIDAWRPKDAEPYRYLGDAYEASGRLKEARAYLEEALRRKPDDVTTRRNYARVLAESGRVAEAISTLESAKIVDAPALNAIGAAYLAAGNPAAAAVQLRRALRLDPDLPETRVNLANALLGLGDSAGAAEMLLAAIRLRPGSAVAHTNLAVLLSDGGDSEQASYHFERAIRSDPNYAIARYNYGRALATKKAYSEAEAQLSLACRLAPELAEAAVSLGLVRMATGRIDSAIEAYRQAIGVKPELAAAHYNLGLALLARGEVAQAGDEFEAVTRLHPDDDESHLRAGRALLEQGSYRRAIVHFEAASRSSKPDVRAAAVAGLRTARSLR